MEIYLVGGAVRDELLGREIKDYDYVVVGSTPDELLAKGFTQVGKDFPVFIEPNSGYEFALARKEKKTGKGYHGFEVDFSPETTLEEDLKRRDLTINAIARTTREWPNVIIDPLGGQQDIENKVLSPVGEHYKDDPVRLLRTYRFLARFGPAWSVDISIAGYAKEMLENNEFKHISKERILKEVLGALSEPYWHLFFHDIHVRQALCQNLDIDNLEVKEPLNSLFTTSNFDYNLSVFNNWEPALQLMEALGASNKILRDMKIERWLDDELPGYYSRNKLKEFVWSNPDYWLDFADENDWKNATQLAMQIAFKDAKAMIPGNTDPKIIGDQLQTLRTIIFNNYFIMKTQKEIK